MQKEEPQPDTLRHGTSKDAAIESVFGWPLQLGSQLSCRVVRFSCMFGKLYGHCFQQWGLLPSLQKTTCIVGDSLVVWGFPMGPSGPSVNQV